MVTFADYMTTDPEEMGVKRAEASMAILGAIQEQINLGNLPGIKPENFFLVAHITDRPGRVPQCFPLYNNEDPIIVLGLLNFASMWSGAVLFAGDQSP